MAEHTVMMKETLLALLNSKKYLSLRDILATMNPVDIAAIFDELEEDRLPLLFRLPEELLQRRLSHYLQPQEKHLPEPPPPHVPYQSSLRLLHSGKQSGKNWKLSL